ncbi:MULTISPECIES: LacI family DNA-binding transcriptional regulator [unclassified Hyphomonas]|uniref:LacI family DNA-binding transcriptional regulator n=1 Tax=unclassified Hyphomonas TaxID=2630699 RepID=UPI0025BBEB03|nr:MULTISPECIES: LacI family DNA-binding transcriptional regulator [unclassified Hyphomonas]
MSEHASKSHRKMTMAELAKLAEVDVSTVSRALNDSPLVKEKTKRLILDIAAETGYAVNASARNLRRQSSEAIGIVIPLRPESGQTISDPFYLEMVGAVSQAASRNGYDLIVSIPREDETIAERRLLQTGKADGLIVIGQAGMSQRLEELGPLGRKVVVWGGNAGHLNYTLVGSDNVEGGRLAGDHLLSIARKRILFLGPGRLPEVQLRYNGFLKAHDERGVRWDDTLTLDIEFGAKNAFEEVLQFLDSGKKFDAIFAASDVLAMSALLALNARGISVPDDVAVVGYDNIAQAGMATPSLTTIDQNIARGGELMVEKLLAQLAGETAKSELTPTQLIVRESSGGSR